MTSSPSQYLYIVPPPPADPGASPLWQGLQKLDLGAVNSAVRSGADVNERDGNGDTPLLMIARAGHYKYPPSEIPAVGAGEGIGGRRMDVICNSALLI